MPQFAGLAIRGGVDLPRNTLNTRERGGGDKPRNTRNTRKREREKMNHEIHGTHGKESGAKINHGIHGIHGKERGKVNYGMH
jgi:hypothetical protein